MDHMERRTLNLNNIKYFVLDEADKMLEMGFIDDIKKILGQTNKTKQGLLFSATMPTVIKTIIAQHFKNPAHIKGQMHVDRTLLKQVYYNIRPEEKFSLIVHLLKSEQGISLVFCSTRNEVDSVTRNLHTNGIKAMSIHGGLTQSKRLHVVEMLKREQITVLVATDVAARGLDIKNITHVFNYDLPQSSDEYTHRIGRTARAGEKGDAIILLTQKDYGKFQNILSDRSLKIEKAELPVFPPLRFERSQQRSGGFSSGPRRSTGSQGRSYSSSSSGSAGSGRSEGPRHRSFGARR